MTFMRKMLAALAATMALLALGGCAYPYPYYPAPVQVDPFERSWNAALGAVGDVGLTLTQADRQAGIIRGARGSLEGVISVRTLADGRVGVEISARDPGAQDPAIVQRLTAAYNARMGR